MTMNKRHTALFFCLFFTSFISGMMGDEESMPKLIPLKEIPKIVIPIAELPQDVSESIFYHQIVDIHNNVETPEEARDYLFAVHWTSKKYCKLTNDPIFMRTIIGNLSATLRNKK